MQDFKPVLRARWVIYAVRKSANFVSLDGTIKAVLGMARMHVLVGW